MNIETAINRKKSKSTDNSELNKTDTSINEQTQSTQGDEADSNKTTSVKQNGNGIVTIYDQQLSNGGNTVISRDALILVPDAEYNQQIKHNDINKIHTAGEVRIETRILYSMKVINLKSFVCLSFLYL